MQKAEILHPNRKSPRIPRYDYSTVNSYFVTICTHERKCIFYSGGVLNECGIIAQNCLRQIPEHYPGYRIDNYVVMPNHVHAIITIEDEGAKGLTYVVGQYKSVVTKLIHKNHPSLAVWQRSFHDRVIRNQAGFEKIWNYIETNPLRWSEDCFYSRDE